MKASQWG